MAGSIGGRIKKARLDAGMTQPELAKACGWASQGRVSNYERDLREPKSSDVEVLAKALRVTEGWIWTGSGNNKSEKTNFDNSPHQDDYAMIPQLTIKGSAGDGHFNDHVEIKAGMAFKREWIERKKLREDDLFVIYAEGQSMEPKIYDGDVLLIDVSKKNPVHGRVFAIRRPDGDISLKRLFQGMGGAWEIVSDNPDKITYRTEILGEESVHEAAIIGMAVWHGGDL
ncbi:hypothetical protein R84981_002851 [Carnimonas sp. R-84981]